MRLIQHVCVVSIQTLFEMCSSMSRLETAVPNTLKQQHGISVLSSAAECTGLTIRTIFITSTGIPSVQTCVQQCSTVQAPFMSTVRAP